MFGQKNMELDRFRVKAAGGCDDSDEEHEDLQSILEAAEGVRGDLGESLMHAAVHRRLLRLLSSPPSVVADVLRKLLEGRAILGERSGLTHKELEAQLRSRKSLSIDLAVLLAHLEEECENFRKMAARLEQAREVRERMSKSLDKQIADHAKLAEDAKQLRAAEKAARGEIVSARAALKSAKKDATAAVREVEAALATEKTSEKRLREKLAADRMQVAALAAEAEVVAARIKDAEAALVRDRAVVAATEARLCTTQTQLAGANSVLADAERGLAATEASVETTLAKNEQATHRLEGLRYRLMDAMRDVVRAKDELGHAERIAMRAAVPLWRR